VESKYHSIQDVSDI